MAELLPNSRLEGLVENTTCIVQGEEFEGIEIALQLMAEESGMSVNMEGFEACMTEQRERSRAAGKAGAGPLLKFEAEATAHLQRSGVQITDDSPK